MKAYVGDGIAADFYRQIAHSLDRRMWPTSCEDVLAQTGHSEFVVHEVKTASSQHAGQGAADAVGTPSAR